MAQAAASINLPIPPEKVWRLIGGFASLPDWLPYIQGSEPGEGGCVRRLTTAGGDVIVERLLTFNDAARTYTYSIVQGPFAVADYVATLRVHDVDGARSRVEWSGRFNPTGMTEEEAVRLFRGIYEDGLQALATRFEAAGS